MTAISFKNHHRRYIHSMAEFEYRTLAAIKLDLTYSRTVCSDYAMPACMPSIFQKLFLRQRKHTYARTHIASVTCYR